MLNKRISRAEGDKLESVGRSRKSCNERNIIKLYSTLGKRREYLFFIRENQ
jgi:hypothetical protein